MNNRAPKTVDKGVSRRAWLLGAAASLLTVGSMGPATDPAEAGVWLRVMPPAVQPTPLVYKNSNTVLANEGVPVDDFPVGRISQNPLSLAVAPTRPLGNAATGWINTATFPLNSSSQETLIPINTSIYTGTFVAGSFVMFFEPSTGNIIYGPVQSYAAGVLHMKANASIIYGLNGQVVAGTTNNNQVIGTQMTNAQLVMHSPAAMLPSVYTAVTVNGLASNFVSLVQDWDFRFWSLGFTSGYAATNPVRFVQCLFDQASLAVTYGAAFFNLGQPYSMAFCDLDWNWRRYMVLANVVSDSTTNSTVVVDVVPQKPASYLRNSAGITDAAGPVDSTWRCVNLTNPGSMFPTTVSSISGNSITFNTYAGDQQPTIAPIKAGNPVKANDVLAFFPDPYVTAFLTGVCTSVKFCNVTALVDIFDVGHGLGAYANLCDISCNVIFNTGASARGHADIHQKYGGIGTPWVFRNNVILCGYKPGSFDTSTDPRLNLAAAMRMDNPRDAWIGGCFTTLSNGFLWSDLIVLAPIDKPFGCFSRAGRNPYYTPVLGTRAMANGGTRISYPMGSLSGGAGGGGDYYSGDQYKFVSPDVTALNGPLATDGGCTISPTNNSNYGLLLPTQAQNIGDPSFQIGTSAPGGYINGNDFQKLGTTTGNSSSQANGLKGIMLFLDAACTIYLGTILSATSTSITVSDSGGLAQPLTTSTPVYIAAWMDLPNVPFSAPVATPISTTGTIASYTTALTVASVAGITNGMACSLGAGVTVVGVNASTKVVTLSGPVGNFSGVNVCFGSFSSFIGMNIGLVRFNNLYFRNLAGDSSHVGADANDKELLFGIGFPVSAEKIFDYDTGAPITFSYQFNLVDLSKTALVNKATSVNPQLPAPTIRSAAKTGTGTVQITLTAANSNALGGMVSPDGGATWLPATLDGTGTVLTVSGLTAGLQQFQTRFMNLANDVGVAVNPGLASASYPFSLAA